MEEWLFKVAARKVIIKICTLVVAWLMSGLVQGYLTKFGVHTDSVTLQASLTGTVLTGWKMFEDWANLKYGWNL